MTNNRYNDDEEDKIVDDMPANDRHYQPQINNFYHRDFSKENHLNKDVEDDYYNRGYRDGRFHNKDHILHKINEINHGNKILVISIFLFFTSLFMPWLKERISGLGIENNTSAFEGEAVSAAIISFVFLMFIVIIMYFDFRSFPLPVFKNISHDNIITIFSLEIFMLSYVQFSFYKNFITMGISISTGAYVGMFSSIGMVIGSLIRNKLKKYNNVQ